MFAACSGQLTVLLQQHLPLGCSRGAPRGNLPRRGQALHPAPHHACAPSAISHRGGKAASSRRMALWGRCAQARAQRVPEQPWRRGWGAGKRVLPS